ncbi:hypothetical protein Glove_25g32 [Diversispora epigaea]|uniref:Uncharacterized protein n=1 Tax=Diversispora epigaea TaxID=1348612 RepID=A0A397JUZ8_9GLOM|nr:hypothetical protein Glove_25g32 [Diversispora epigaea]
MNLRTLNNYYEIHERSDSLSKIIESVSSDTVKESTSEQEDNLPVPVKLDQSRISDSNDRFVWGDLIDICASRKKYTRNKVYEAIQAIIAYINRGKKFWIFKVEDEDKDVKIINERAVKKDLIVPNVISPKTNFFNLFLGFSVKPEKNINSEIMDPILWHSTLQQCGKNIIVDFISDKVLGPNLYYIKFDPETFLENLTVLFQEGKVNIERKNLEPKPIHLKDFFAFICLAKILEHLDTPEVVMAYLLNRDFSNWDSQDIPTIKMKPDTILKQLPNPILFIIQHIKLWPENRIDKPICSYLVWE